ncbi:arylsulfatase [Sedimentisphaera salicampi]|uniref:Arylsulfatase n=1 Tax=Sedimentisphaera salicampi TaxID=1941349 RepID=A0A1W6LNT1_9BACT|nr:arylsulfatase [Sedimentisphaera salicampi]ARN57450.1 Arylsulfatase [Sedimentisphaera salicampi]OXU14466.1 Arylsulfatase [Sedimentisphaera salicampi]
MDKKFFSRRNFLKATGAGVIAAAAGSYGLAAPTDRPNIVVVLVDDMGYSDIGCYGGEIDTPNLDNLAQNGVRFSQFYNTARCCPTRASLMTGLHPHQTDIGHMTNPPNSKKHDKGVEGYRGSMNKNCVTIAEVLKTAGYHTYMAGKWHLGMSERHMWPLQRGFDRFYGILAGASNFFRPEPPRGITRDNEQIEINDPNYYTTDAFTDNAIKFIKEQKDQEPFFLYLAYTAPHWPLHAKKEDVEKFRGKYMKGWDKIREERNKRQIEMGLLKDWEMAPRDARPWDSLSEKKKDEMDYRMAVYAAQVHSMDYNVGKLVESLKKQGKLDNTLILFMSDNGGCAEGGELGGAPLDRVNNPKYYGCISYGRAWANASNTPFRRYKHYVHEGGISTPLIAHWPKATAKTKGTITHETGYLIDIMATCTDLAGAEYPEKFKGHKIPKSDGISLVPAITTGKRQGHKYMFFEHEYHAAVRKGKWKAVRHKLWEDENKWELYDMEADRTELSDLAEKKPELVKELSQKWYEWAEKVNCIPKPGRKVKR